MSDAELDRVRLLVVALFNKGAHEALANKAASAVAQFPEEADFYGYASHAHRHLNNLAEALDWAERGMAVDPNNLLVINRYSLACALNGRLEEIINLVPDLIDRVPEGSGEAQNLAVTLTNVIYAYHHTGRIQEAVELLTPIIERLNHDDLHFNAACMYALASDRRALRYVRKALLPGIKTADDFNNESDFDAIRADEEFGRLLARNWQRERNALGNATYETVRPEAFIEWLWAGEPAQEARNADLEREIIKELKGTEPYLVYGDWLQEQGDPRGQLISLGAKARSVDGESERMLSYCDWADWLARYAEHFVGPLLPLMGLRGVTAEWHLGFVKRLSFDVGYTDRAHRRSTAAAVAVLQEALLHSSFPFLQRLFVGDLWCGDEISYGGLVEMLAQWTLPSLRHLWIEPSNYQISWTNMDAVPLARSLPQLESLTLGAGSFDFMPFDRPALKRFAVHTGGLSQENLRALSHSKFPNLEGLEIWFGDENYGASCSVEDLGRILSGDDLPVVKHLGLMNSEFADEICADLVDAPILEQLETLDLSMGIMTDEGARFIADNPESFRHLKRLSVAANNLSAEMCQRLETVCPEVDTASQQEADFRYVSVGE